jgi:predicted nucleic acid-binding protein
MPRSPRCLLDSNVIAKWFVQEEDSEKAIEIRDLFIEKRIRVSTISLAPYELGNVLWKHPSKTAEAVREDFDSLSEMTIPTLDLEDSQVLARVFQTARNLGITFYDASYLIAALVSRAVLVTADARLLGKLKGPNGSVLLGDWKGPIRRILRRSKQGSLTKLKPPVRDKHGRSD